MGLRNRGYRGFIPSLILKCGVLNNNNRYCMYQIPDWNVNGHLEFIVSKFFQGSPSAWILYSPGSQFIQGSGEGSKGIFHHFIELLPLS